MIYTPGTYLPVSGVYAFQQDETKLIVTAVYTGAALLWQLVRSCYGKGYWITDKPWLNEDGWKNNV